MQREINKRKFYATLPHKLDKAITDYKKETLHDIPVVESEFQETGTFGEDGWSISRTLKLEDDA